MTNESSLPTNVGSNDSVRPVAEARWCVVDANTGTAVAQGCAPTVDEASREATHYALQYAQDHPVRWCVRQDRKTVVQGRLAGVTITRTPHVTTAAELRQQAASDTSCVGAFARARPGKA